MCTPSTAVGTAAVAYKRCLYVPIDSWTHKWVTNARWMHYFLVLKNNVCPPGLSSKTSVQFYEYTHKRADTQQAASHVTQQSHPSPGAFSAAAGITTPRQCTHNAARSTAESQRIYENTRADLFDGPVAASCRDILLDRPVEPRCLLLRHYSLFVATYDVSFVCSSLLRSRSKRRKWPRSFCREHSSRQRQWGRRGSICTGWACNSRMVW